MSESESIDIKAEVVPKGRDVGGWVQLLIALLIVAGILGLHVVGYYDRVYLSVDQCGDTMLVEQTTQKEWEEKLELVRIVTGKLLTRL